ncbi:MAG: hypothetical protein KGZ64_09960 [Thermaerobacter sp.]|nr:hypothetical protein [Thermaerobacter sp.]
MYAKVKVFGLIMLLLTSILLPSYRASATVSVITGFVSERKTTFITLDHEDASPMARLISDLSQNVDAIDNVFARLHNGGRLQSTHATLVITISDDAYQGLLAQPMQGGFAVLSLQNSYRLDFDPQGIAADLGLVGSVNLGPVYLVEVALWPITVKDLLAMVFLLPELSQENPRLELTAASIRELRERGMRFEIERLAGEWSSNDLVWSPDGRLLLTGAWHNRRLSYILYNFTTNRRTLLDPLHLSIMPPTFSPDSRYVVSASNHELRIMDVRRQQTWRLPFVDIIPEQFELISVARFAVNNRGDALFFSLFGYGMEEPLALVWRSREPSTLERITGLEFMAKPQLPGETWSDFVARRHPAIVKTVQEFAAVAKELAAGREATLTPLEQQLRDRYGAFYAAVDNHPKDSHLALLASDEARLLARVLALPSLKEIDVSAFALVPESRRQIPGTMAGISLFNVAVAAVILLLTLGITKLFGVAEKRFSPRLHLLTRIRKKRLTFVCALLVTLGLHLLASLATFMVVHDRMGERAREIATAALAHSYGAGLGYTVQGQGGSISVAGSSPLVLFDFPYQALYWHALGRDFFAAPVRITMRYLVFDHLGHLVSTEENRFYVLSVGKVVRE